MNLVFAYDIWCLCCFIIQILSYTNQDTYVGHVAYHLMRLDERNALKCV